MEYLHRTSEYFKDIIGFTNTFDKEHKIQKTLLYASLVNLFIMKLTYEAHYAVLGDVTLRIYFEDI